MNTEERLSSLEKQQNIGKLNGINLFDIIGMVETTTTIPTKGASSLKQQIVIYINNLSSPTVKRLYIYSNKARLWSYVTLT